MKERDFHSLPLYGPDGVRLDAVDLQVLRRLHEDARIQNAQLASEVGLSPSACLQRIRRLESSQVVGRHMAEIDESMFSAWSIFWVTIQLRRKARARRGEFVAAAMTVPEITEAHELADGYDFLLKVALPSVAAWWGVRARLDCENALIKRAELIPGVRIAKHRSPHPALLSERRA